MRKEFVYSVMALGAIPITVNAADVQTCDVQASTDGSKVTYPVGKLVPGSYTFSAKLTSKVYGVKVKIAGETADIATANNPEKPNVTIKFDLDKETDVELELVSTDPGEAGAGFTVADAKVILNFELAKAKEDWATAIGVLKDENVSAYPYDSDDDVKAADKLIEDLNKIDDTYENYVNLKLYQDASVPQGQIDALAATIADHQNTQAYNDVNAEITKIKNAYNAAVATLEGVLVKEAAYLLGSAEKENTAKWDLNEHINKLITTATQASYAAYQEGKAVEKKVTNITLLPTTDDIDDIVTDWTNQGTATQGKYDALHKVVTDLQADLDAVKVADASLTETFATERSAAQKAIDDINTKVESENVKNTAAQNTLDVSSDKTAAQDKITTLAGKVTKANAEFNANKATTEAIAVVQKAYDDAKKAVDAKVSKDGDYKAADYYAAYLKTQQDAINKLTSDAAKAYNVDGTGTAKAFNEGLAALTAPITTAISAYQTNAIAAVGKYDDLQTAITAYEKDLADARTAAQKIGPDVYTDANYDYETQFDLIQKRINDIKKAITAAKGKVGAAHWEAMQDIDADDDNVKGIEATIADLLAKVQGDQNEFDATALDTGIDDLNKKFDAFYKQADDGAFGDAKVQLTTAEDVIVGAYDDVVFAKDAINANSEIVPYTDNVGQSNTDWLQGEVKHNGADGRTTTVDGVTFVEQWGNSANSGTAIVQTVNDLPNGKYTVKLYAFAGQGGTVGSEEFVHVFANGKTIPVKVTEQSAKNVYTIENVEVTDGTLYMGLSKDKGGTQWHGIQIESLTANTASLIKGWDAKIKDLAKQQTALETEATAIANTVKANVDAKALTQTNVDNLQKAMATFSTTYLTGEKGNLLGLSGEAGGAIKTEVDAINAALTTLEKNNAGVVATAVANKNKTGLVDLTWGGKGTAAESVAPKVTPEGAAEAVLMREDYNGGSCTVTGVIISQEISGLDNGFYDVQLYANANHANNVDNSHAITGDADGVAYVFANEKEVGITAKNANSNSANGLYTIPNVEVKDGKMTIGIGKKKAGTNWHTIQIKSLTFKTSATVAAELAKYNTEYSDLAARKTKLDADAKTTKAAVETNAAINTAATKAVTDLQTAELTMLKNLKNVTNASAVSDDATAKKADPADFKVFETGLDADKSYTARKTAIDADITAMSNAIAASYAAETLATDWKNNSISVTKKVDDKDVTTTYSIAAITQAISKLKADAVVESDNYEAYKALQTTNMAKLLPDTIFTKKVGKDLVAMTDAEIEAICGAGAKAYYVGLQTSYATKKGNILTRMQDDLTKRKAVSTKDAFVAEINALIAQVKVVKSDAEANKKKYDEQKAAYTETQTLWNNTYTEIAATDQSSKVQDWLDELDAIQVTLTAATNAVEANYPKGLSVAEAKDFAAIQAAINDVKAKQAKSYNEFIAADNKAAHESFMGSETTTGTIQLATEAFQRAFDERGKYSSNIQSIQGAINTAAATLDAALYDCPTDIEDLKKKENQAYVKITEANAALGEGELAAVFDVHQYNADAVKIEQGITKDLQDFKNALGTAIADVWTSPEYAKLVKAANDAIKEAETIYGADATAEAFKDVVAVIAKGEASVVKDPEDDTKVVSVDIEALEDAISALTLIDALLDADMNEAANIDLLAEIAQRDTAKDKETLDGYADVKAFDEAAKKVAKAKEDRATYYEAGTLAYIDDKGVLQGYYGDIMTLLNDYTTAFKKIKKDAKDAKDADEANTKAYNEMIEAIAPVEKKLEDAEAAAAAYKYETSFGTQETNLANIKKAVEDAKKNGGAVNYQTKTFDVAKLSTAIDDVLKAAFGTEKAGLATDITELKNQFNAYVAANGLDETANGFKKDIDDLEKALGAAAIKDLDDPADDIQFDEIVAATEALIKLQNDIAAKQVELLGANGNGNANADVLADFQQQLGDLKETASLEGYDKWVGQQAYDNTTLAAAIADLNGQIADLETAIAAEENISFYQDQYQKQIDAIAEELTKVVGEITKKQAQFTANAEAYEKLTKEINDLQTAINDAKEKVGEYEYAANTYIKDIEEYNNADKPKLIGGVQKTLNDAQKDIEDKNAAKSLTETSVVPNKANIEDAIQLYLDKSANKELIEQKANLNTLLTNAIKPGDKEGKMSSRLWKVLTDEKSDISKEITALWKAIIASNLTYEGSFDVVTEQGVMTDVGEYYYTLDKNNQKIAKVRTSDADYADQMIIVQAIQEEIDDLKAAVTNIGYLGDANEDTKVNVLDYQTVVNMILNPELQPEEETILFANTDVNKNDIIEVGDLTAIVNYILTSQWQGGYAAARSMNAEGESIAMNVSPMEQGKQRIAVSLANVSDYTAFQMDMVLPEGMTFVGASLSNRAGESHKLYSRAQKDGSIRVLASSIKGETFSGNEGAVLYIDVEGAGNVELVNILFSDVNAQTHLFTIGGDATGINNVSTFESLKQQVYDFGGRLVKGLKKGMNIIRRNDGSTDKVIVK